MDCRHNFILITKSTRREPPYHFCSKCGEERPKDTQGDKG